MYDPSWSMTDDDIARMESDRFMREEAELARKDAEPVRLGQAVRGWAAEHPQPTPPDRGHTRPRHELPDIR